MNTFWCTNSLADLLLMFKTVELAMRVWRDTLLKISAMFAKMFHRGLNPDVGNFFFCFFFFNVLQNPGAILKTAGVTWAQNTQRDGAQPLHLKTQLHSWSLKLNVTPICLKLAYKRTLLPPVFFFSGWKKKTKCLRCYWPPRSHLENVMGEFVPVVWPC